MRQRAPSFPVDDQCRVRSKCVDGVVFCCTGVLCKLKLVVGLEAGGWTRRDVLVGSSGLGCGGIVGLVTMRRRTRLSARCGPLFH
jgi:hypothetical protein